jgi:hypothetical protein
MNKKGMNVIIAVMLIVVLSMAGVYLLYSNLTKLTKEDFGEEVSCFDVLAVSQSFFIKESCYINSDEILIDIERKSDVIDLTALRIGLYEGDNVTKWEIKKKKCLDIRFTSKEYGGYCDIPKQDEEIKYVFNVSEYSKKSNSQNNSNNNN